MQPQHLNQKPRLNPPDTSQWPSSKTSDQNQAAVVNLSDLCNFLRSIGYRPVELTQVWRNVYGELLDTIGERVFFKMASTPIIGERLQQEIQWYQRVNTQSEGLTYLRAPNVLASDKWNGCLFYVSQWIEGKPLVMPGTRDVSRLRANLSGVLGIISEIDSLRWEPFQRDRGISLADAVTYYDQKIEVYFQGANRPDLAPLYENARSFSEIFQVGISHGDVSPFHILETSHSHLYLIDAEHARAMWPRFWDFAYLLERITTELGEAPLAKELLLNFRQILGNDRDEFDKVFRGVFAARILLAFMNLNTFSNQRKNAPWHEELLTLYQQEFV